MITKVKYINCNCDGTAKAILAGCYKFYAATLLRGGASQYDFDSV